MILVAVPANDRGGGREMGERTSVPVTSFVSRLSLRPLVFASPRATREQLACFKSFRALNKEVVF